MSRMFGASVMDVAKSALSPEVDDNKVRRAELEALRAEYETSSRSGFDGFVNGLNRLPRPILALGAIGLFVYGLVAPEHFERRMAAIDVIPEPLWWLMGAIVSFYFGAREMHYWRQPKKQSRETVLPRARAQENKKPVNSHKVEQDTFPSWELPQVNSQNAAIEDWKAIHLSKR